MPQQPAATRTHEHFHEDGSLWVCGELKSGVAATAPVFLLHW